jgi:hypothetical protein
MLFERLIDIRAFSTGTWPDRTDALHQKYEFMKIFLLIPAMILSALLGGCERSGGSAGGPGAVDSSKKPPLIGLADDTFVLTTANIEMRQGESVTVTVGIKRGTNFDQDVKLTLEDLPAGVTAEPVRPLLSNGGTETKFTLTATDGATMGEFNVKLYGRPSKGGDSTNSFKVTVAKKDTFTLTSPFLTTTLKQGETKVFAIGIKRDQRFDQDVIISFDRLPQGVTIEPASGMIKHGDEEAKMVMKATDDAVLGDFAIKLTGRPTKGVDAVREFKFAVAKK